MQAITLRPETAIDEPLLRQIYAASRNEELAAVPWADAQKSAFLDMQFDLQRSHYRQHYPNAEFLIISQANTPIGRYYLHRGTTDFLLIDIALLPSFRRQGIGSLLLHNLLAEAEEADKPVQLHVEQFNPAQHLYRKLGFSVIEDKGVHYFMQWQPPARKN
ncbi:MAG: GNAT family N-acetyltransferase [Methylovulum sp.]|nr:GNAT family N-acetyltransferase [Methylovulum sp.]